MTGPWDNLPDSPKTKEPLFKRGWRGREAMVSNWRGLVLIIFLILIAPPIATWIAGLIMGRLT